MTGNPDSYLVRYRGGCEVIKVYTGVRSFIKLPTPSLRLFSLLTPTLDVLN